MQFDSTRRCRRLQVLSKFYRMMRLCKLRSNFTEFGLSFKFYEPDHRQSSPFLESTIDLDVYIHSNKVITLSTLVSTKTIGNLICCGKKYY